MIISQPAHSKKKKDTFWQTKLTNPTFTHQEFTVLKKPLFQAKLHLNTVLLEHKLCWTCHRHSTSTAAAMWSLNVAYWMLLLDTFLLTKAQSLYIVSSAIFNNHKTTKRDKENVSDQGEN